MGRDETMPVLGPEKESHSAALLRVNFDRLDQEGLPRFVAFSSKRLLGGCLIAVQLFETLYVQGRGAKSPCRTKPAQ